MNSETPASHPDCDVVVYEAPGGEVRVDVRFRQWATRTLRGHLVRGYTLNERRLAERGLREARETLDLLTRTLRNQALVDDTGQAVLEKDDRRPLLASEAVARPSAAPAGERPRQPPPLPEGKDTRPPLAAAPRDSAQRNRQAGRHPPPLMIA